MTYDWDNATFSSANATFPSGMVPVPDREDGLQSNPEGGHGDLRNHPADCPCPGHSCTGAIAVEFTASWNTDTTVIHYLYPGGPEDYRETSSQSSSIVLGDHYRTSAVAARDVDIERCWPRIELGDETGSFVIIYHGLLSVIIPVPDHVVADVEVDPLTSAVAYEYSASGTASYDDGGTLTQTLVTGSWSYNIRWAVHPELL